MKDYLDILTKEKYELKIQEDINRRLYDKKNISYEMYISINNDILKQLQKENWLYFYYLNIIFNVVEVKLWIY